jgi:NAD-dependent deacetylase
VDPPCELCGGILKSDTISFGQNLVPDVIQSAIEAVNQSDLMIAVGSTLSVFPAASLVPQARQIGAPVIIVNGQETAMDDRANVLVRGLIGEVLPAIVGATG